MADTIQIPDVGLLAFADLCVKDTPGNLYINLYTTEITANVTDIVGTFTVMDTDDNTTYAQKTLSAASWVTAILSTVQGVTTYAAQTWDNFTSMGTSTNVWGYIVTNGTGGTGDLMWACYFEAARPIQYDTESITITPTFKFGRT